MATKQQKIESIPSDELVRQQLATAKVHQPFHDFVRAVLGIGPGDYDVIYDEVQPDGWRVIDLQVYTPSQGDYMTGIFLRPGQVTRFPPSLDIPF